VAAAQRAAELTRRVPVRSQLRQRRRRLVRRRAATPAVGRGGAGRRQAARALGLALEVRGDGGVEAGALAEGEHAVHSLAHLIN